MDEGGKVERAVDLVRQVSDTSVFALLGATAATSPPLPT